MVSGLASLNFLQLLFLLVSAYGSGVNAREMTELAAHSASHMDQMNHSLKIFFTMNELKAGKFFPTSLPMNDPSTSPPLLPREEADLIPFSSQELPQILDYFSFSHDSTQAKAIEDAVKRCETNPIKGETKLCATSLESMFDFVRSIFGLEMDFQVLSTTHLTKSIATYQNYTILKVPKEIYSPKMVACHTVPYPYAIFYCHSQETETKIFSVPLGAEDGDRVEAVAACHMDTSHWSPDHISFRMLGIKPGSSHVCHLFATDNLVFVPKSTH
ncbi:hypothetical protein Pint_34619 [Pistacia integerrima]|uniref:Uncharacterized protein n=1 Tax=Pistacia integerrima TaxID=434235 RepID=A0ACC0X845_9ROSI|nr:hypothetical protein Pint_34619 [Pistacia integerrima]